VGVHRCTHWACHHSNPYPEIDVLERPEVLALLGSVSGKEVLELGAGIGRFTVRLEIFANFIS
jgi:hypothetical protein